MSAPDPSRLPDLAGRDAEDHWREEDARIHARVLQIAAMGSLGLLALAFLLDLAGIAPGLVPASELPLHWQQSSAHWRALMARAAAGGPAGDAAGWAPGTGDLLCLVALLALCLASLPALAVLLVRLLRRRDWPLAAFAALNILVIEVALLAALS
jgi:hypothetical protein